MAKQIGKFGYYTAIILTIVGVFLCLGPYLLSSSFYEQVALILYGEEYARKALPALESMPVIEVTHRVLGAVYLIIGVLQINKNFRNNNLALHRTLGKLFMLFSITGAITGLVFVFFVPFSGVWESVPVFAAAAVMLYSTYKAWVHIRKREIRLHQEWILRSYAIGIGIVTIRVFTLIIRMLTSINMTSNLLISLWLGWIITFSLVHYYTLISRPKWAGPQVQ